MAAADAGKMDTGAGDKGKKPAAAAETVELVRWLSIPVHSPSTTGRFLLV